MPHEYEWHWMKIAKKGCLFGNQMVYLWQGETTYMKGRIIPIVRQKVVSEIDFISFVPV